MRLRALASVFLILAGSSVYGASVEIVNVGADASVGFEIQGGFIAMRTSEARAGATDLNGDGDAVDSVLQVYDIDADVLRNTALEASGGFRMAGRYIAFSVLESRQGGMDLNGDGDASDLVQHVYDAIGGISTNLGLASGSFRIDGNTLAFTAVESSNGGQDLNGDGDASDGVLHTYSLSTGTLRNVGRDAAGGFVVSADRVAFAVSEGNQGGMDLNGDGDAVDSVVHLVDAATGTVTNLQKATLSLQFQLAGNLLAFLVRESFQGGTQLNGDTDVNDNVLHLYNVSGATTTNLGRAASSFQLSGSILAFAQSEGAQGAVDANGDGDDLDDVLHFYDASSAVLENLEFAIEGFQLDSGHLAFAVREFRHHGVDLNGDGDTADLVLHLFDVGAATVTNLETDATLGFKLDGDTLLAFGAWEGAQGAIDLNGDGDVSDFVLHVFDIDSGTLLNLEVDPSGGFQSFQVDGKFLSFGVQEPAQGAADLNGDGDAADIVLHYFESGAPPIVNLGFDVTAGHQITGGRIGFLVTEARQGLTDLNGDGDTGDVILHVADVRSDSVRDLLLALIAHVKSLSLPHGIEKKYVFVLELALHSLDRGKPCHTVFLLEAFQHLVHENIGKKLSKATAKELKTEAQAIIDLLHDQNPCGKPKPHHQLCKRGHHKQWFKHWFKNFKKKH